MQTAKAEPILEGRGWTVQRKVVRLEQQPYTVALLLGKHGAYPCDRARCCQIHSTPIAAISLSCAKMVSGKKITAGNKHKRTTPAQRAARSRNLHSYKENIPPAVAVPGPPPKQVTPPKDWKKEYEKLQRRFRHSKAREKKLEADIAAFNLTDAASKRSADAAAQRITELSSVIEKFVFEGHKKSTASKTKMDGLRKKVKSLKQRVRRSIRSLSRSVDRARKQLSVRRVTAKGVYTAEARKLARIMVDSGCARGKVGPLMERVGAVFGIHINRVMSRRTVGRAVEEGGVAAKMQVAFELSSSKGVTISADSTSNRGINIESAHMALRVPDYASGNLEIDPSATPKVRVLGVEKTIDHTSAEAVWGWDDRINESCDIFNRSPLAKRLERVYSVRDFMRILNGMNGDHASMEKGTARALGERKHDGTIQDLGEAALAGKSYMMELVHYLSAWNAKKVAEAGGEEGWKSLSPAEQAMRDAKLMRDIVTVLGMEAYDILPPEVPERRQLDLFVWGGCCMHKDMNSFKGGNAEMMLEWKKLGQDGPVLLCNKQNASILRHFLDRARPKDAAMSEDEFKAFEASTCGGNLQQQG
ncbi:hypothetical protein B0H19DRAFT_1067470 [Mycena capillaripes]|nr:hypothetical protein B0H19DRAFT_1067470 [Mycena capillaripes]